MSIAVNRIAKLFQHMILRQRRADYNIRSDWQLGRLGTSQDDSLKWRQPDGIDHFCFDPASCHLTSSLPSTGRIRSDFAALSVASSVKRLVVTK